jgi:hypothetical protein
MRYRPKDVIRYPQLARALSTIDYE